MSFKEDFFEALRSVKRDFFGNNDRGSEEPAETENVVGASVSGSLREESGDFRMPDNIVTPDDDRAAEKPAGSFMSDSEVRDAFRQASAVQDDGEDDEAALDDEEEQAYASAANLGAEPFQAYNPPAETENPDLPAAPVSADARKIYDFNGTDLYSDDKNVIYRNTVIRGALQSDDSIRLLGQILGDIECKSNIVVAGKVRGNTSAANAYLVDAQIDGDMFCDDSVSINKDAWVLGNIRAQQADIDGKIKGNIEIRHTVSIGADSSVIGNISTDELEIKRGAFVNGQVIMYSPSRDVIDRFEDFDRY